MSPFEKNITKISNNILFSNLNGIILLGKIAFLGYATHLVKKSVCFVSVALYVCLCNKMG